MKNNSTTILCKKGYFPKTIKENTIYKWPNGSMVCSDYGYHLKTKEGVDRATLIIYDKFRLALLYRGIKMPEDMENEFFEDLNNFIDDLAGNPDYRNYN